MGHAAIALREQFTPQPEASASTIARSIEIDNVDRLCAMAATLLEVPFVTVVWGANGARSQQHCWAREDSEHPAHMEAIRVLCSSTVLGNTAVTVDDIRESPVFSSLLTATASSIRACAGVPLMTPADQLIGHLFAMDLVTRPWSERELSVLTTVCRLVALAIKLCDAASVSEQRADSISHEFEAQEDLLAEIAHDLRQPLSLISNCGELLSRDELPQRHKHAEMLRKGVRTMKTLIDEMLTGKPSATLDLRHMDPANMVLEAVNHLMPLAARHGLSIEGSAEEGLPALHCDLIKVERVFSNLIGNAIKFAAPSSTIRIRSRRVSRGVQFCVSNSGPDISAADVSQVFERRWQATQGGEGRGLGLAIVKKLIEAHGGAVGVNSTAGVTSFWFTLPY